MLMVLEGGWVVSLSLSSVLLVGNYVFGQRSSRANAKKRFMKMVIEQVEVSILLSWKVVALCLLFNKLNGESLTSDAAMSTWSFQAGHWLCEGAPGDLWFRASVGDLIGYRCSDLVGHSTLYKVSRNPISLDSCWLGQIASSFNLVKTENIAFYWKSRNIMAKYWCKLL